MNNINDLQDCISLVAYLRAEPIEYLLSPTRGVGVAGKKRKKSQCHPPKNFFMPRRCPPKIALSAQIAACLITTPLSPSLPLGYHPKRPKTTYNPLSRVIPTAPIYSAYQPRHQAFNEATARATRSAKRLLKYLHLKGGYDTQAAELSATLTANILALRTFFELPA